MRSIEQHRQPGHGSDYLHRVWPGSYFEPVDALSRAFKPGVDYVKCAP